MARVVAPLAATERVEWERVTGTYSTFSPAVDTPILLVASL